ncbi:MAG: Flp pilus assembly complex ATPase component TadA [Planctomycetes bacterium]|nr:Flp pilus assembly complex ATPase component TadA [Planctomycetota bacterium]
MSAARSRKRLGEILVERGSCSQAQVDKALAEQQRAGGRVGEILVAMGAVKTDELTRALGVQAGLQPVDLDSLQIPDVVRKRMDGATCALYRAVPIREEGKGLVVALADPVNVNVLEDLSFIVGGEVRAMIADDAQVDRALQRYWPRENSSGGAGMAEAIKEAKTAAGSVDLEDKEGMAAAAPVVKLLNYVLLQAIRDKASDIHLEPFETEFKVRYRVDGVLFEVESPPLSLAPALVSRVKVMSNLDIAETRVPQDGRIELSLGGKPIDLRVSTMPTVHGESCVLRVLDRSVVSLDLGRVGLRDDDLAVISALLRRPHGIVLVTGPTGSGKTTTLYSALNQLNDIERKIITVEDPIEYDLDGIVQVQVAEEIGVSYASVLRTILRQDPDILLVGEIRDQETARIAVEAALTGHLILSTLHTNDAPSTITRLVDIGIPPYLIVATLEAVVAQRLVRSVCPDCRVEYVPDDGVLGELGVERTTLGGRRLAYGKGCETCNFSGHKGRRALFEIMVLSERLRGMILDGAPTQDLRQAAIAEGMRTLRESGQLAVLDGSTTVEEVLRETLLDT